MAASSLSLAEKRFKASKYAEVIKLLEPQIVKYRDNSRFYYLLGASCLYAGDAGGAFTYLKRAEQIHQGIDVSLGLGALALKRGEAEKAMDYYLEILEKEPRDRKAKIGLEVLRKNGDPEALSAWLEKGELPKLYPRGGRGQLRNVLIVLTSILLALTIGYWGFVEIKARLPAPRPEISTIGLAKDEMEEAADFGGSYRYILDENRILESFEKAKRLFGEYRDNPALVEVNRILNSNASKKIKNKALLLKSYVVQPNFETLKDSYDYRSVAKDPYLFEGCSVAWKGRVTNFESENGMTRLDLLVGYHGGKVLEGIVPVTFDFEVSADPASPMEILGAIQITDGSIRLRGLALHELPATK